MNIHEELPLLECPYCGGAGLLEEERGWCWYVTCVDCGSQTASFEFKTPEERMDAARKAAQLWNMGKVVRADIGE
ncbi:MAG: Lar family restriction alleviation protein [Oscillospiraceae bacterium]|nr:Lar family restriction alleviation protein [Oscillospiraceae bacterium]